MSLLSIVLPAYKEEKNVETVYVRLKEVLAACGMDWEIIFVNDASPDHTWEKIMQVAAQDKRVKGISFSRNFGQQMAISAGYDAAQGDAVISMDCDLQDPPALIPELLKAWQDGHDIVYARRRQRSEGFLKQFTAKAYYRLLGRYSDVEIPRNVGDFRLLDRQVIEELRQFKERFRYLRGMVAWLGFKAAYVDFDRPNREQGETSYTWKKMFTLAFDGLAGFSLFPLKIAAYLGSLVVLAGVGMFIYITADTLFFNEYYPLYKWLVVVLFILMGIQFILLWIIGEYVGRIYDQGKGRPLYVVREKANL